MDIGYKLFDIFQYCSNDDITLNDKGFNINDKHNISLLYDHLNLVYGENKEIVNDLKFKVFIKHVIVESRILQIDEIWSILKWINPNNVETVRYFSGVYFCIYHFDKFQNTINQTSFISYILDLIFDQSSRVFSLIKLIYHIDTKSLYFKFLNDKRLKEWLNNHFENEKTRQLLVEKIETINSLLSLRIDSSVNDDYYTDSANQTYDIPRLTIELLEKVQNDNQFYETIVNEFKPSLLNYSTHNKYAYRNGDFTVKNELYKDEINYNNSIITGTPTTFEPLSKLNNVILFKIIDYIISFYLDPYNYGPSNNMKKSIMDISNINLNLSMVNKKLFTLYSQILNQHEFPWYNKFNLNSKWCLIKKPPLFLNYHSIKCVEWYGIDDVEGIQSIFSRIETFNLHSDEINFKQIKQSFIHSTYNRKFKNSVTSKTYYSYLPAMPNLKSIKVLRYIHFSVGDGSTPRSRLSPIDKLLISIFSNCPPNTIQSFYINYSTGGANHSLNFLSTLFKHHSNSLKSIQILDKVKTHFTDDIYVVKKNLVFQNLIEILSSSPSPSPKITIYIAPKDNEKNTGCKINQIYPIEFDEYKNEKVEIDSIKSYKNITCFKMTNKFC